MNYLIEEGSFLSFCAAKHTRGAEIIGSYLYLNHLDSRVLQM